MEIYEFYPFYKNVLGDGGGGLYIFDSTINKYIVVGILNYIAGCAGARLPAIFTRISYYQDWITANSAYQIKSTPFQPFNIAVYIIVVAVVVPTIIVIIIIIIFTFYWKRRVSVPSLKDENEINPQLNNQIPNYLTE